MNLHFAQNWEIAVELALIVVFAAIGIWILLHKRANADELERQRRAFLSHSGRLVDGMLLDVYEIEAPRKPSAKHKDQPPVMLTMLLYSYRIGGVDYECSQDITALGDAVEVAQVRAGFPCSVRYQPGNPQNSIVIAESWTGLRVGLPVLPAFDDPEPIDLSHLRPGRG